MTQLLICLLTLLFSLSNPAMERNAAFWQSSLAAKNVTKEIKVRPTPGRDGATSTHIIERVDSQVNSVTHQVTKDGKVLHQHQSHVGKYGAERRFPDEWIEYPTILKE